jgi:tRNA nucleotidyltransferase (CCA-adding enzyme)
MSDYNFLMETRLKPEHFRVVSQISRAAGEQGLNLYLVGGAVRDLTYGQQTIHDLDFSVEGNPEKVIRYFPGAVSRPDAAAADSSAPLQVEVAQFTRRLTSAEVVFSNGVRAEISMSRGEVYSKPGKPPEIHPATIFEDLRRRDFSVNAMAVSLHPNSRGLLLDPTNGAADIEKRELRVLHGRSLSEDPSRIYRLLRLGLRLGFKPEERTARHLASTLENRVWMRLDPVQQGNELRAILREEDPGRILKQLGAQGLLAGLDKKLSARKIAFDQFKRILSVSQGVPGSDPFLLNFHTLVAKLGGGQRARLARKIIVEPKAVRTALGLEQAAKKLARLLGSARAASPSKAYAILAQQPPTLLLFVLVHFPQAKVQNRVKHFLQKAPQVLASMPRNEFLSLGAKPGPKFEKIVQQLFFDQLDGKIKAHPQLVREFRRLAGIPEPKPAKPAHPKPKVKAAPEHAPAKHAAAEQAAPSKPAKHAAPSKPVKRAQPPRKGAANKPKKTKAPAGKSKRKGKAKSKRR